MDCNKGTRIFLSTCGIVLSLYALYVTQNAIRDKESYVPFCDLGKAVSCTKLFLSRYGRGFGVMRYLVGKKSWLNFPNTAVWIGLYCMATVLSALAPIGRRVEFLTTVYGAMCSLSVYHVYALYKLQNVCVVSIAMYVINFLMFFLAFKRYNEIESVRKFKTE